VTPAAASRAPARPVRTVFIGSGPFAVPALRALASDPAAKLVGVVTAPPRPAGRGLDTVDTPVGEAAVDLGVASLVLTPPRLRDPAAIAEVLALKPGLIVLADYGQIVPAALSGCARARSTSIRHSCPGTAARRPSRCRSWPVTSRPASR